MSARQLATQLARLSISSHTIAATRASCSRLASSTFVHSAVRSFATHSDPSALALGNLWPLQPPKRVSRQNILCTYTLPDLT